MPAEDELRKFWEYWGFKWQHAYHDFWELVSPDGIQFDLTIYKGRPNKYPPLDMNSIEKWVLSKLIEKEWYPTLCYDEFERIWRFEIHDNDGEWKDAGNNEVELAIYEATRPLWDKEQSTLD